MVNGGRQLRLGDPVLTETSILLYIWFEHTNGINLGYIILLTSDLYNYQASQLFEQKMIFISMENPRQFILIASSSKEKPLHSSSEFCQQSLYSVTRPTTSFCTLSVGSWTQQNSWSRLFLCLDQSPRTLRNSAETPAHSKHIVSTHRKYKPVGFRRYSPFRKILGNRFLKYYKSCNWMSNHQMDNECCHSTKAWGCWLRAKAVSQDPTDLLPALNQDLLVHQARPQAKLGVAGSQGTRPMRISTCFNFHCRGGEEGNYNSHPILLMLTIQCLF